MLSPVPASPTKPTSPNKQTFYNCCVFAEPCNSPFSMGKIEINRNSFLMDVGRGANSLHHSFCIYRIRSTLAFPKRDEKWNPIAIYVWSRNGSHLIRSNFFSSWIAIYIYLYIFLLNMRSAVGFLVCCSSSCSTIDICLDITTMAKLFNQPNQLSAY